jgi:hypothetical protein
VFLENSLVFVLAMAETLLKNLEVFEAPVEGFMTGFNSVLECLDCFSVEWVVDADLFGLALAPFVTDHSLVGRDLASQAIWLLVDSDVILSRRKWTIDPD